MHGLFGGRVRERAAVMRDGTNSGRLSLRDNETSLYFLASILTFKVFWHFLFSLQVIHRCFANLSWFSFIISTSRQLRHAGLASKISILKVVVHFSYRKQHS